MCKHKKFDAKVSTVRTEQPPVQFYIEVTLNCADCGTPFRFTHSFVSTTDGAQLTANVKEGLLQENRVLAEINSDYDYLHQP